METWRTYAGHKLICTRQYETCNKRPMEHTAEHKICKRLHTFRKLRLYALSYKQQIQTKRVLHSHSKPFLLDRFLGRLFLLRLPIQYTRRRLSTYGQLRYICVPSENIALAVAGNIIRLKSSENTGKPAGNINSRNGEKI